jgi:hypothetical protein
VNSWKIILATIVIFGAGVITGGLLVNHVKHPAYVRPPHPTTPPAPPSEMGDMPAPMRAQMLNKQFVGQLDDELQLTKDQREQIQKIIAQGQQSARDLWKLVGPQFQIISRDTRQQIREVLTPEQRKQFEILVKQQRHPSSTNAPPTQLTVPTNTPPPVQPPATNNGTAV